MKLGLNTKVRWTTKAKDMAKEESLILMVHTTMETGSKEEEKVGESREHLMVLSIRVSGEMTTGKDWASSTSSMARSYLAASLGIRNTAKAVSSILMGRRLSAFTTMTWKLDLLIRTQITSVVLM